MSNFLMQVGRLTLGMVLLATAACGFELHAGHQAVHATALWRRTARHDPPRSPRAGSLQQVASRDVEINAHYAKFINMTTELQDMMSEYIGEVGVGTSKAGEAQFNARVVFDTGSTNLWVASVLCSDDPCSADTQKRFYDPAKSFTQSDYIHHDEFGGSEKNSDIDIKFGTGELKGPLHTDTYRVGPMVVKNQPFAMIREMTGSVFRSFPFEGILGLAFPGLSFGGIKPFFDTVIDQKLLEKNEFAFFLNVDRTRPSALLWGGIDPDLYHGDIKMFPVVQPHYWSLELVDFKMGNTSFQDFEGKKMKRVIVDSGTTYFTAPKKMLHRIKSQIPEAPCSEVENYPNLTYTLRGVDQQLYDLEVPQTVYMVGRGLDTCQPAFMGLDVKNEYGPALILGEVFMNHFFTVFSRGDGKVENARIGFAPARIGATPKVKSQKPSFIEEYEANLHHHAHHGLVRREAI